MANAAALIQESLWRNNPDFRRLPRGAQCTYVQLCSTRDLDCAGQLTLHVELLTKACDELTVETVWHDLKILEDARFIFIDTATDELLIRSYVRLVSARSPNAYRSALRAAKLINSPKLRLELAIELRRLGRKDADEIATAITPATTPSESHPDPIAIPSEGDIPSGSHREPPVSVLVQYESSPSVGGWVGRAADAAAPCPKHPNGPKHNEPCRDCQRIREHDAARRAAEAAADTERRAARRAAIDACPHCDEQGWRETPAGVIRCTHEASHA